MTMAGHRRPRDRGAFSFVEALMAVAVLAITATFVYPVFVSGQRIDTAGRHRIVASNFARETLERVRSNALPASAGYQVDPLPADHFFHTQLGGLREVRLEDFREAGAPVGRRITVTVSWDAPELGARNSERLVLFVSDGWGLAVCP